MGITGLVSLCGNNTAPYDTWAKATSSLQTLLNLWVSGGGNVAIIAAGKDYPGVNYGPPNSADPLNNGWNFIIADPYGEYVDISGQKSGLTGSVEFNTPAYNTPANLNCTFCNYQGTTSTPNISQLYIKGITFAPLSHSGQSGTYGGQRGAFVIGYNPSANIIVEDCQFIEQQAGPIEIYCLSAGSGSGIINFRRNLFVGATPVYTYSYETSHSGGVVFENNIFIKVAFSYAQYNSFLLQDSGLSNNERTTANNNTFYDVGGSTVLINRNASSARFKHNIIFNQYGPSANPVYDTSGNYTQHNSSNLTAYGLNSTIVSAVPSPVYFVNLPYRSSLINNTLSDIASAVSGSRYTRYDIMGNDRASGSTTPGPILPVSNVLSENPYYSTYANTSLQNTISASISSGQLIITQPFQNFIDSDS